MTDPHLPRRHRPVIRVFVSSTFSDLTHERNVLQANVWPALERSCRQRGFQFQAIDLRWGVPTEAGLGHRTMRICFEELRRSQETSPQPNFLILLGDRYGWRPLPEEISTDEFQDLQKQAADEPASRTVLNDWYPLDENTVPPVHVLRSRRDSPDGRDYTDEQNWNEVQAVLWSIINRAFPPDRLPGRFDGPAEAGSPSGTTPSIVRFQASATEQEIWHGALQVADARQHVFALVRKIENLDDCVRQGNGDRRLKDFVDLTPEGQRDTVAQEAHDALREALRRRLGENYQEITTTARLETPPNQIELDVTTGHLALLCQEVQTRLERVIDQQVRDYWQDVQAAGEQQSAAPSSPAPSAARTARELELEIEEHVRFGRERAPQGGFVGRESEIRSLREYLAGDDRQPLVVYGPSGTGKTALLAHVALPDVTLPGDSLPVGSPLTIVRFLGTTPGSSGVRPLLMSLCRQLRDFFPLEVELPSDLNELTDEFHEQLARATSERPIQLFLDALDQLDDADAGRQLGWLRVSPSQPLPPQVKLVVSCLSDAEDDPAGAPSRRLSHPELLNRGIKLQELSAEEAVSLLFDRWLKSSLESDEPVTDPFSRPRRTLTNKQRDVIKSHITRPDARECRRPLYLKILYEEARLWRSFDPVPPLGDGVFALLQRLFRRLRRRDQHGRLVRPALGYLVTARYGLTETELLEILFADPGYKAHLDQFNAATGHQFPPGARRIPIALWARLRYDLAPYLAERAAPGGSVLNFYHRQVGQFVRQWLLEGRPAASYFRNRRLARYWLRQPWWLESRERQRARMQPPYSARPAHLRKATELPEMLFGMARTAREAGLVSETESAWRHIEKLFQRLDFLEAKNEGGLVFELPLDFRQAIETLPKDRPQRQIFKVLGKTLRRDIHFIDRHREDYPQGLFQRLWNSGWWYDCPEAARHYEDLAAQSTDPPWERNDPKLSVILEGWRHKKARVTPGFCWLRSLRPPPVPLQAPLRSVLVGHKQAVTSLAFSTHRACLASGSRDGTIRCWTIGEHGQPPVVMDEHDQTVEALAFSSDASRLASISEDGTLRIWDGTNHRLLHTVQVVEWNGRRMAALSFSPDGQQVATSELNANDNLHLVSIWNCDDVRPVARYHSKCLAETLAWSPQRHLIGAGWLWKDRDAGVIRVWEASTNVEIFQVALHHGHGRPVLSPDGQHLAVASTSRYGFGGFEQVVQIWDLDSQAEILSRVWITKESLEDVRCVAFSPTEGVWACGVGRRVFVEGLDGRNLACLHGHSHQVNAIVFVPNSSLLASGAWDETVRIWDTISASELESRKLLGPAAAIRDIAISPDGHWTVCAAEDDSVWLWNTETGVGVPKLSGFHARCVSFSADSRQIVLGLAEATLLGGEGIFSFDIATGSTTLSIPTESPVVRLEVSSDGRMLAYGLFDGTLQVIDVESRATLLSSRAHSAYSDSIRQIGFLCDDTQLVAVLRSGRVWLWDLATRTQQPLPPELGALGTFANLVQQLPLGQPEKAIELLELIRSALKFLGDETGFEALRVHPESRMLAGSQGGYLCLFQLEGNVTLEGQRPSGSDFQATWTQGRGLGDYGTDPIRNVIEQQSRRRQPPQIEATAPNVEPSPSAEERLQVSAEELRELLTDCELETVEYFCRNQRAPSKSSMITNARAVIAMRGGEVEQSIQLLRPIALRGIHLRTGVPTEFAVNLATALLLNGNVAGCLSVLAELRAGGLSNLRCEQILESVRSWRRQQSIFRRLMMACGLRQEVAIPLDFVPGEIPVPDSSRSS